MDKHTLKLGDPGYIDPRIQHPYNANDTTADPQSAAHTAGEYTYSAARGTDWSYRLQGPGISFALPGGDEHNGPRLQSVAERLNDLVAQRDSLVAALEGLLAELGHPMNDYGDATPEQVTAIEQARAALDSAKGGKR